MSTVTLAESEAAAARCAPHVLRTPLLPHCAASEQARRVRLAHVRITLDELAAFRAKPGL